MLRMRNNVDAKSIDARSLEPKSVNRWSGTVSRQVQKYPAQIELGARVRERRNELGLSQMKLADRIGLHFTFVSSIERGERNLSLSSLLVLAEGLEIDPADLVEGLLWDPDPVEKSKQRVS